MMVRTGAWGNGGSRSGMRDGGAVPLSAYFVAAVSYLEREFVS
jgi:hypothetical protein